MMEARYKNGNEKKQAEQAAEEEARARELAARDVEEVFKQLTRERQGAPAGSGVSAKEEPVRPAVVQ